VFKIFKNCENIYDKYKTYVMRGGTCYFILLEYKVK